MKTTFELKTWLSENREIVISKYNDLTNEKFFNGITLKNFMLEVLKSMSQNDIRSEKRAAQLLPTLMGMVYFNNSTVGAVNNLDKAIENKYVGTAYMALV